MIAVRLCSLSRSDHPSSMPLNLPPPKASTSSSGPPGRANGVPAPAHSGVNGHNSASETDLPSTSIDPSTSSASTPSFSSKLGLPPPKTKSKQAAATQPKKFVLDLPKPSRPASELRDDGEQDKLDGEPAAKKPRTAGGGLGALLPEPKKPAGTGIKLPDPKVPPAAAGSAGSHSTSTSLLPPTLRNKNKTAQAKPVETPSAISNGRIEAVQSTEGGAEAEAEAEEDDPAVLDWFGLGPTTAEDDEDEDDDEQPQQAAADFFGLAAPTASTSSSKSAVKAAPAPKKASLHPVAAAGPSSTTSTKKFSAAPTTAAPDLASNYYSTLPVPTKSDPYPGFYQKPDGTWAPRRPDEWEIWTKAQGWGEEAAEEAEAAQEKERPLPADFAASAAEQSVEVRAANLRGKPGNGAQDPSLIGKFTSEDQKKMEEDANRAKSKRFSHNARSRHQLTTLVADAQANRAALEERISQMKNNKRTGGQKYGF